jgi:hypothetical protein
MHGNATIRRAAKRHVIASIHYGARVPGVRGFDGPSYLDCKCGASLSASTPEALADLWRAHGGSVE